MASEPNTYDDFVKLVRSYDRESLLRAIALLAIELSQNDHMQLFQGGKPTAITPFALAAISKEAILASWHRGRRPKFVDIDRMAEKYLSIGDAFSFGEPDGLERFMVQTAYEQFSWQRSAYPELARSHALYVEAARDWGAEVINTQLWESSLGCSLYDYVGAAFVWWVGASGHGGYVDRSWVDQDSFVPIREEVSRDHLLAVLDRFTGSYDDIRNHSANTRPSDATLRRFEFNPLEGLPVVRLPHGELLAPQPAFIIRKASATGLFYDAVGAAGEEFTTELGHVFEHYVGMQLRDIPNLVVYDEIEFGTAALPVRSVDYFVDTGNTLVLVEVKSARLTANARAGGPRLATDLQRSLGRAFEQVARDVRHVRDRHPSFRHLPDREHHAALIVTLEPFFMTHSDDLRRFAGVDPTIPTVVASASELEHMVSVGLATSLGPLLDEALQRGPDIQGQHPRLFEEMSEQDFVDNPMLSRAWDSYPWNGSTDGDA